MEFACVDIGGTNTLVGVGNDSFEIIEKVSTEAFLQDMAGSLERILDTSGHQLTDLNQIAFAAAGPIDREKGVFYPPNIDDMDAVQLREPIEDAGVDVKIVNDCNSAVLGEYVYGDTDVDDLVYLTISTGIGAGIIVDGTLVEGNNGNFGEIGHIIIDNNGRPCGCGGRDHWEAYCSGKNLPRMAHEVFGHDYEDARAIFDAYYNNDKDAAEIVDQMQEYNARGIANIINIFDPEHIAIGGGVALNHPNIVVDGLQKRIEQESVNGVPHIEAASLREEAVIHGLRAVCNGEHQNIML